MTWKGKVTGFTENGKVQTAHHIRLDENEREGTFDGGSSKEIN